MEELTSSWRSTFISARDQLIQVKWLHRVYLTPTRLVRIHRLQVDTCTRCHMGRGTLIHVIWECSALQSFWSEIHQFLNTKLGFPAVCAPENSLLGLIEDLVPSKFERLLYKALLFYARKIILLNWKPPKRPTVSHWVQLINAAYLCIKASMLLEGLRIAFMIFGVPGYLHKQR